MNEITTNMMLTADIERLSANFPVTRGEDHFWSFTCFSRRRRSEPTPDEVSALLIAYGFKDQSDRPLNVSRVLQSLPEHEAPGQ